MFGTAHRKSDVDLTFYQAAHALSVERRLTEPWLETRSLPTLTRSYPRRFTFYVADPVSSIHEQRGYSCWFHGPYAAYDRWLTNLPGALSDASCTPNRFRRFSFCMLEENDKAVA